MDCGRVFKITGDKSGAVITGKSVPNGGSLGRQGDARGGMLVLALRERLELPGRELRFRVSKARNIRRLASEADIKSWRSDSKGAAANLNGLNLRRLKRTKGERNACRSAGCGSG